MLFAGCGGAPSEPKQDSVWQTVEAQNNDEDAGATLNISSSEMRRRLGASDAARFQRAGQHFTAAYLANSGVETLAPLEGQPLKELDLSQTKVAVLAPLEGMPLERISLFETPVSDLSPLQNAPLTFLDASKTNVADLTALAGMTSLDILYLEGAKVEDVSPLKTVPVSKLWLIGCPVSDLSPLRDRSFAELNLCETGVTSLEDVGTMSLGTLWLRDTKVADLSPLAGKDLVSLDVEGTPVSDLSPLAEMASLRRLNIAGTKVTDVTPLANLSLERLIFSPEQVTAGIEVIRSSTSIRQIDVKFDGVNPALSASEFWEKYDAGEFQSAAP